MQSNLINILLEMLQFNDLTLNQYVFSMVGDLQKNLANCSKDQLPQFIRCAIVNLYHSDQYLDPSNNHLPVCNNACWCIGQMATQPISQEVVSPFTEEIVSKLAIIYNHKKLNKSLA